MHLLERALLGVDPEADEALRAEGRRDAVRGGVGRAVVRELEVGVSRRGRGRAVSDLHGHVDHVAVALEAVDLGDREAVLASGAEPQFQQIASRRQGALARLRAPQRAMVRACFAGETALRFVAMLAT